MTEERRRVLLIEDNPADQQHIVELLADSEPAFEIEIASTPEEGVRLCRDKQVDCIVLDYLLDTHDGIALIPRIKEIDHFCPIIVLTGTGSEKVAAASIKQGAFEYLTKSEVADANLDQHIHRAITEAAGRRELARRENELARASRLDALGELAGGLAHDFNNLFTTLQYAITLGLKKSGSASGQHHLRDALGVLERGSELTERLKSFAAHQPGTVKACRVGDVLASFNALVGATIGEQIAIEIHADDPDQLVQCDRSQLDHALVNLALNARDAILDSGKGGRITLTVTSTQSGVAGSARPLLEFAVADDGPGMTREVHERAVDPYFSTKERGPGTGLGLAMVYGFVQQSQGEFSIETELGVGTAVRIRLPLGQRERVPPPAMKSTQPCRAAADRRPAILVVDDEVLLLMEAAEIIRDFGYDVLEASSAEEALTLIRPDKPVDLLLTDVHMPRMNGFALAKAARDKLPDLKILYYSGYTGYTEADMGATIAPLISKPCNPPDLEARLRNLLQDEPDGATPLGISAHMPLSPPQHPR